MTTNKKIGIGFDLRDMMNPPRIPGLLRGLSSVGIQRTAGSGPRRISFLDELVE
jgi:hypothetical protein